jgi:hypothetical protein
MTKKITFVTYTTQGKVEEEVEFEDHETEDDIKERFFDWMCEENGAYWFAEGEE